MKRGLLMYHKDCQIPPPPLPHKRWRSLLWTKIAGTRKIISQNTVLRFAGNVFGLRAQQPKWRSLLWTKIAGTRKIISQNTVLRLRGKCLWAPRSTAKKGSGLQIVKWSGTGFQTRNFRAPRTPLWDPVKLLSFHRWRDWFIWRAPLQLVTI